MSRTKILKIISWFMTGLLTTLAFLILFCPLGQMGETHARAATSSVCQENSSSDKVLPTTGSINGCFDFHAGLASLLSSASTEAAIFFAGVFVLILLVVYFAQGSSPFSWFENKIRHRFRHYYRRYVTVIKLRYEEKLRSWFALISDHTIAHSA